MIDMRPLEGQDFILAASGQHENPDRSEREWALDA